MTVTYSSNWTEAELEVDRVMREATPSTLLRLDAALATLRGIGFAATHKDTTALANSITPSSNYSAATKTWRGQLQWGTAPDGTPVDYAIYERRRGGEHDFVAPVKAADGVIVAAIQKGLAR